MRHADQVTDVVAFRPRYGIEKFAFASSEEIVKDELAVGLKHPRHFPVKSRFVGDIHLYMFHPHHVKARIGKRKFQCISDVE